MEHRIKNLLSGPGFYGVLALCILAAGVGGYFLLLREKPPEETAVRPDVQAASPVTDLPEHEPAAEETPLPEETPDTAEVSAPAAMPEKNIFLFIIFSSSKVVFFKQKTKRCSVVFYGNVIPA